MKTPLSLVVLLFLSVALNAQTAVQGSLLKTIPDNIAGFKHAGAAEKVYLHFDNTAYYKGDKIWFKAYVVTADLNVPNVLSKVLYVDLLTQEGSVAETRKYKIENGVCNGNFMLTDSLLAGYYEVRAYTKFMLNEGVDAVFSRVFPVFDKPVSPGAYQNPKMKVLPNSKRLPNFRPEEKNARKLRMAFYPEGGHLVRGLTTRVAFELTGEDGRPVSATGYVFSDKNDTLAEVNTGHLGRGLFVLTPGSGSCEVRCYAGKKLYRFALPAAEKEGVSLTADRSTDHFVVLIQKTPDFRGGTLGLAVTSRGHLFASDQIQFGEEGAQTLKLPFDKIPSGVSQLTLYNDQGSILAQRCVFVNHHNQLNMSLVADSGKAKPFAQIRLDFKLENALKSPVQTEFSLAVRDAACSPYNKYAETIFTNLLLSSELKGYIENPAYYFEKEDSRHQLDLDILLMVQGWSRFDWKYLAGLDKNPLPFLAEDQLYIEGKVRKVLKNKPFPGVDVQMVQMMESTSQHGQCVTDEQGRFGMELVDFYGKSTLILQTTRKGKKQNASIMLDRVFRPDPKVYTSAERLVPASDTTFLTPDTLVMEEILANETKGSGGKQAAAMNQKVHQLKEVKVKGNRKIQRYDEAIRNSSIIYDVEKTVDEIVDKTGDEPSDILEYLSSMNPYFYYESASLYARYKGKTVIYVLNGELVRGGNEQFFYTLTLGLVQTITISESSEMAMIYDPNNPALLLGKELVVIFVYTNPSFRDRTSPNGVRRTLFYGYDKPDEFYHPEYGKFTLPDDTDYRRTLYWNPSVKTDNQGKATVRFWNNAHTRGYVVSAETVSETGAPGSLLEQIQPE